MNTLIKRKTPWLDMPLVFSGNYREYECTLNETSQCDYQQGYWRFWYEADHRYALPTVAFFLAVIIVFGIGHVAGMVFSQRVLQTSPATRIRAMIRYLSYRTIRIPSLDWNSAPLGILILAVIGIIFFFAMTLGPKPYYWPNTDQVDYGSSPPIATRTGWMALACMPFVFMTAGKANFITLCTGVSHERLQVFHRWISYAFLVLALIHTFPFIVYNIQMGMMTDMWNGSIFYWTGVVALVAQGWLTFASWGPLRNLCYEWFKFSHFVAALVFVLFLFFHCDATLTAWDYFVVTGVLYSLSWLYRQTRIYFEHGIHHRAELSLASNGFIEVRIPTNATWTAGQHYFIRFMTLGLHAWTVHPFTACSLPSSVRVQDSGYSSELVFFIRPRGGFTARLAHLIQSQSTGRVRVLLDGPYGGVQSSAMYNSDRMLLIAGGSGAGWTLPFVISFLRQSVKESPHTSSRSLKIILATRDTLTTKWFEETIQQLLHSHSTADHNPALEVEIFYTGSETNKEKPVQTAQFLKPEHDLEDNGPKGDQDEITFAKSRSDVLSESSSPELQYIQHHEMRPNLASIVKNEAESLGRGQSLGVCVCGPLSMQSDVANQVAREQLSVARRGTGDVILHMEHFSWA